MASVQAGLFNPLGSPREFGSPHVTKSPRVVNVFEAGVNPVQVSSAVSTTDALPAQSSPAGATAPPRVPRDPKSPQTQKALWEPLHDWTQLDDSDVFPHLAGGELGVISRAGHGRIKKKSNRTEIDFYTKLSEPDMISLAPKFCGSHISNGNDWTHFVILEDLTAPFSKPSVLDLQIGQEHVGDGDPGTAKALGLRINGMRRHTNEGISHYDKTWGGQVQAATFANELEEFLTDASKNLRAEVAGTVVSFLDQLEPWVAAQTTLELIGSSLLIVYEGDTTVVDPPAPQVRIIDFKDVRVCTASIQETPKASAARFRALTAQVPESAQTECANKKYLTGIRNLRWMLERLEAYCELEMAKEDAKAGVTALREVQKAMQEATSKCSAAEKKCAELSPEKGPFTSAIKVLHEDIIKEEVALQVMQQEDNVIAAFLKAVLSKHKINSGEDAFIELLQWRLQPLIMDRVSVMDICERYGLNTAAVDDLLKWKETSDTRLRELHYVYDVKLSAAPVLPSYYDLLVKQEDIQARLIGQ